MFPFHPIRRFAGPLFRSAGFRFQSTTTTRKPQNMKQLMKEYGYPALAVYLGLSCIDLPICYVLVHSMGQEKIEVYENKIKQVFGYGVSEEELAKKQEINRIQKQVEASETPDTPNQESKSVVSYLLSQFSWTEFAIAYGIHKSLIFIRLPITAAITPGVVKLLRGWGFRIGTDKLSTTANIAKDLAKTGIKDITASSPKFGVKPGKKKWWWFF
ncbi:putative N-terminal peptidyl-methionine acetyltransferase [Candida maltosa Xu316]|uniref:Putative N-terminal peptidyl-methionine acetyltransferase n=1 Tax=Candida maltosa (strain Xu316) TaxID=1245528 RepID=M3HRA3_CANMX|nr:putative N-terminal peptidyl-methionine acetyltransferase [Candida maltosa Xu316]